ncbi:MAG: ribonuclease P protein component [Pseudomonadota bacterium]|nr:ribonuclease P protein component [Pseudomonadota bacterium]
MALARNQRRNKKAVFGKHISLKVSPVSLKYQQDSPEGGVVIIPKRFVSKAVDRNKAKRQCEALIQDLFLQQGVGSIVVRVYTNPSDLMAISKALKECLKQLRIDDV